MDTILADIRSGVRMLATYPALSLVAVVTLGLGIGLSTTVFCVVNGGLFKGLPFSGCRSHRVVGRHQSVPASATPADRCAGPRGLAGAADVVRKNGRVRVCAVELVERPG